MTPNEFVSTCQAQFPGSPGEAYLNGRGRYATASAHVGWFGFDSHLWPTLRDRVILPVYHPYHGELVAITGRRINDDQSQKYWNTPNFKKTRMIYGLPRPEPRETPIAIVEGQLDVLALEALGIPAYAVFGKDGISGWQIGLIRRISDSVILWPDREVYDGVLRSWSKACRLLSVTSGPYPIDPEATDPDKICQRHGDDVRRFYGQLVA